MLFKGKLTFLLCQMYPGGQFSAVVCFYHRKFYLKNIFFCSQKHEYWLLVLLFDHEQHRLCYSKFNKLYVKQCVNSTRNTDWKCQRQRERERNRGLWIVNSGSPHIFSSHLFLCLSLASKNDAILAGFIRICFTYIESCSKMIEHM